MGRQLSKARHAARHYAPWQERVFPGHIRRADVVGIFLTEASIIRLIGAVLLEANDEWQLQHGYMGIEAMAELPTVELDVVLVAQPVPEGADLKKGHESFGRPHSRIDPAKNCRRDAPRYSTIVFSPRMIITSTAIPGRRLR